MTFPAADHAPLRSKANPWCSRTHASSRALPGPVSKPFDSSGERIVMLEIPPNVRHYAFAPGRPEQRFVERRHQRCSLAARRHVSPPEVSDRVDTADLRDAMGIPDLHGMGRFRAGGRVELSVHGCRWP